MGRKIVRLSAGVSGLALSWALAAASPALAQAGAPAATPAPAASVEEIVVTGTNIRGVAPVGSTIVGVTRSDIVSSGAVTTTQLLQQTPQVFNLGVSESSRGQSGGSSNITYGSTINLRGIGPYATLTLVDGHRVVPEGPGGQAVDPSVIPTIMLERVEIVADGASAVYGSDAVAGVANLIMRRHFNGLETSVHFGYANGYDERQIGVLGGKSWDSGQFTVGFENGYHSNLSGENRSFYTANLTSRGGNDFRVTSCNPATLTIGGVNYAVPSTGVTQATASALVAGTSNKCDNLKQEDLLPRQDHYSLAYTFDQNVGDRVHLFGDGFYTDREFAIRTAGLSGSLTIRNSSPDFVLPAGATATTETANYAFANNLPDNVQSGYSRSYNLMFGGDVKLPHDFKATATYSYGGDSDFSLTSQGLNTTALNAAIASGAFNPLNPASNPLNVPFVNDAVFASPNRGLDQIYTAKIDGPLFKLPGGDVRIAVGYEGQRQEVQLGIFQGIPVSPGIYTRTYRHFARTVNSGYVEVLAPLIGPENGIPFIRRLDIDLAGRYDSYSDIHAITRNPKYGINWSPTDGLTLHGSYGTSFRAPIINQIYGNSSALFVQNYTDPTCGCVIQGVARSGGNTSLQPETARTYSFGGDFTPAFAPGLKIGVNYFDIRYTNQVLAELSNLSILGSEAQFAGTGIIVRNPSTAFINSLLALGLPVNGVLPANVGVYVDGRSQNLGVTLAKGIDFQVHYRLPWTTYGNFSTGVDGEYFTEYKVAVTPKAPLVDLLNTIFNPLTLRMRGSIAWNEGPMSANLFVNYENAYKNTVQAVPQTVAAYVTVDARLAYAFKAGHDWWSKDWTVSVEALNLFDAQPPFVNIGESANGGGGFDPTTTSPVGRVVSFTIDKKW
jgi:iron complex outermembrane receptor protein